MSKPLIQELEELTLMRLYLQAAPQKAYRQEALTSLERQGMLNGSNRPQAITLTPEGQKKALALIERYQSQEPVF